MAEDASTVSLGGETAKGTVAKAAMALIGFVGTILFARLLGPSQFGSYHLLLSVALLVERPISGGWSSAAKKRASEAGSSEGEIVGAQLLVGGLWVVVASAGAMVFADSLHSYTGIDGAVFLLIFLLAAKILYISIVPLILARGRVGVHVGIDALRSYFTFFLQLGFVSLGFGVASLVYGLGIATLLMIPVGIYFLRTVPRWPSLALLGNMWEYARYSIPTGVLWKTYDKFDILLLGALLTQTAAGYYEVAMKLTFPAMLVAEIAGAGLMVRVSNLESKGQSAAHDISNVIAFSSILSIPLFFGALAIARPTIVTIFGGEYAEAAPLLLGLAVYRILTTQTIPLYKSLNGFDMPRVNLQISIVTLAVNIVLGVGLTLWLGAIGVVLATVIAEALRYLGLTLVVKRESPDVDLFPVELFKQFAAGGIMFVGVTTLHSVVPVRSWVDLAGLLVVGSGLYGVVLLIISRQLRLTIKSILSGSRIEGLVPSWALK